MRVGLIRHFPVEEPLPNGWRTCADLMAWRERYDASPAKVGTIDVGAFPWAGCLSSDLPRAAVTAQATYRGTIELTSLLREAEFTEFRTGRLRLPVVAWRWLFRCAWFTNHPSQRIYRDDFRKRVRAIADKIVMRGEDLLVVSHAGTMAYLSRELRRRGFTGPKISVATHAKLYVFERQAVASAATVPQI